MLLKTGNVYFVDMPKSEGERISERRPVIVLSNIGEDMIQVVPLSTKIKNIHKDRITINLMLNDKNSYVTILCDEILTIPKKSIITQIGKVNSEVLNKILSITNNLPTAQTSEIILEDNTSVGMQIKDEYMGKLEKYIISSNDILNQMVSKKAMFTNIFIAIITGIIASLLTNWIWLFIVD